MSMLNAYMDLQDSLEQKYGHNSIVLYMKGSFYEMYSVNTHDKKIGNLHTICKVLNITLTKCDKSKEHSETNPYMCGFPSYALGKHLSRLLTNHYTVSVYDEVNNDDNTKKRELVGVYSPSTYIDEEIIDNNILTCIYIDNFICPIQNIKINVGYFASIDLSTGKNTIYECYDTKDNLNNVKNETNKLVFSINPCEIIIIDKNNIINIDEINTTLIHKLDKDKKFTDPNYQNELLKKVFGKSALMSPIEFVGLERNGELLYCYIQLLQFAYEHDPNIIKRIQKPEYLSLTNQLILNNDALSELNIINISNKSSKNKIKCLFDVVNKTSTPMGARLLKERLLYPVTDIDELNKRYSYVDNVYTNYKDYESILKKIADLEKKHRKIVLLRLNPFEFARLDETFANVLELLDFAKSSFDIDDCKWQEFRNFYTNYKRTFNIDEMSKYDLTNIKTSFFNPKVDERITLMQSKIINLRENFEKISDWINNLNTKNKAKLKLVESEKDGYYFTTTQNKWDELCKKNPELKDDKLKLELVGNDKKLCVSIDDFFMKDKTKNSIKISCNLIDILSKKLAMQISKIRILVKNKYLEKLRNYEKKYGDTFIYFVKLISEIDVAVSTAHVSTIYSYKKPTIIEKERSFLDVKDIRHPIIERIDDNNEYITNDFSIGMATFGSFLYGLNSSGKSSLLRAIGVNVILAQGGLFVAASQFCFNPFTKVLSKISSSDNLFRGQSTFILEMCILKEILSKSDTRSLVLCDELTAGTETLSATGIVASSMIQLLNKKSNAVFTTHLHDIMNFPEITNHKHLNIFHFKITIDGVKIVYDRVLKKGSGDSKYGIEIANAMGLEKKFIKDAFKFRARVENDSTNLLENKRSRYNAKVIVDSCDICGSKESLHSHHINEQHTSDENGIINHFHQNIKHNIQILCQKCHVKHHQEERDALSSNVHGNRLK